MLIRCFGLVVSVHKDVLFCRMAVEITEEKYVSAFQSLFHHEFSVIEDWILFAARAKIGRAHV